MLLAMRSALIGGTATFANKNVGTGKTVTLTGAVLAGADAGNYSLSSVATTTANITAKSITGSFTAANKVYDGNVSATVLTRTLTVWLAGDAVSLDRWDRDLREQERRHRQDGDPDGCDAWPVPMRATTR